MTTTKPGTDTKVCPRCAEEIKVEAKICRYCHAQFAVEHHGYCAHCHAVVKLAEGSETCPVCRGPLVDILTESRLAEPPPTTFAAPPPAPAMPAAPAATPPLPAAAPHHAPTAPAPTAPAQPTITAPIGQLRRAVVPTMLQWVGTKVAGLAIAGMIFVPVLSFAFEGMRLSADQGSFLSESKALGPAYIVIGFVMAFLMPWRAVPKTVDGSRARALVNAGPFARKVRAELHVQGLFRAGGFVARIITVAVLWLGSIALFMATGDTPEGWETRAGTPTMWTVLLVGLVSTLLILPLGHTRHVRLDDEGNFFPDEGSAI